MVSALVVRSAVLPAIADCSAVILRCLYAELKGLGIVWLGISTKSSVAINAKQGEHHILTRCRSKLHPKSGLGGQHQKRRMSANLPVGHFCIPSLLLPKVDVWRWGLLAMRALSSYPTHIPRQTKLTTVGRLMLQGYALCSHPTHRPWTYLLGT